MSHFDAMEWEMRIAGDPLCQRDPDLLEIVGILARMADADGVIDTNPDTYPDDPSAALMALCLQEMHANENGVGAFLTIPEDAPTVVVLDQPDGDSPGPTR